jgi:uroporphyrinogen-III decarboxylase
MLTPYERLLLAYLGKQPDQVPVGISPFPIHGVPKLEESAGRAHPHYPHWDRKTRIEKALAFNVQFAKRFPDVCVCSGIGSGGHGDAALHLAPILGSSIGKDVVLKESRKGGYVYAEPLIEDLAVFDVDELYIPNLREAPAFTTVIETVETRLDMEVDAYTGLEDHVAAGMNGWASTRCVEDVVDQGLISYQQLLIGMTLWPHKVHRLCDVTTDHVIAQLTQLEKVMGKITKLTIADHCTTFMSRNQAQTFWLPYVRRVNEAFSGAIHIYHNEGQIIHLVDLIPQAGFDAYQVGPETNLSKVRTLVGDGLSLFGNIDPVHTLPSGTPTEVENACQNAIVQGGGTGGFILSTGGGPPRNGAPVQNFEAMINAAQQYGTYPLTA